MSIAQPDHPTTTERAITARGVAFGALAAALTSGWISFARTGAATSDVNITHIPVAFLGVFLLIAVTNFSLRNRGFRGLVPSEMFTILIMSLVAGMVPARGLTGTWLGLMAAPYYLATPENGWIDYIQPNLSSWLFPRNDYGETKWLYEGLPEGVPIPWQVWVMPVFWWLALIIAGFVVCISIVVILRKQWMEYERLDYPLVSRILDLVDDSEDASGTPRWPSLLRGRFFWMGFAFSFGIIAWNMVGYFDTQWPNISLSPLGGRFYACRICPWIITHLNPYTIGFGYFVKSEILFSIWAFHLLFIAQVVFLRRTGLQLGGKDVPGQSWGDPVVMWQSLGALFAFVIWGLWTARHHLIAVVRKALGREVDLDDSDEMLPYRTAALALILGVLFIAFWMAKTGVPLALIAFIIPTAIVLYIALARFVCESGTLYLSLPTSPLEVGYQMVGTATLSARTVVAAATTTTLPWMLFMPALSQGAKAADRIRGSKRTLFWALLIGLLVALIVNIVIVLWNGYTYGAFNFAEFPFTRYAPRRIGGMVKTIKNPQAASLPHLFVFLLGAAVMIALTVVRYRMSSWTLHPIGYAASTTNIRLQVTSLFVVWIIKTLVTRIGGVQLYQRLYPLFLGLIIGRTAGTLLSFIVDLIWFPGSGHGVHGWA
jgi:hypothetical protein